jgi:amino acid transporter
VAILASWGLSNMIAIERQGYINAFAACFQLLGLVVLVVALMFANEHMPSSYVFFKVRENPELPQAYSMLLGLLLVQYSFTGLDSAAHVSEETQHAAAAVPKAQMQATFLGVAGGLVYLVALLYVTTDLEGTVAAGSAVHYLLTHALGRSAALVMMVYLVLCMQFTGASSVTVSSRIVFAMARDGGLPSSNFLKTVNPHSHLPVRCIVFVFLFETVLLTLSLASETAFAVLASIATIGLQISYVIPIVLRALSSSFEPSSFSLEHWSKPVHLPAHHALVRAF